MSTKLVFATANKNKVKEIQQLLPVNIQLLSLSEIGIAEEIPETQATIEGNASQKAFYVYNKYHINCFADDTGLEIEALENRPGVMSARYAGENKNAEDNMKKVLDEMQDISNRKARFKTVISLVIDGKEIQFEGIVNGTILTEKCGTNGFGYDPIFAPQISPLFFGEGEPVLSEGLRTPSESIVEEGLRPSFAQMDLSEKNKISHRAIAVNKLVEYLRSIN